MLKKFNLLATGFLLFCCMPSMLLFLACTRITEAPAPQQPPYIGINNDYYSCSSGQIIQLTPLDNDSLRGKFTLKMGVAAHGATFMQHDTINYQAPDRFGGIDSITYILENSTTQESGLILINVAYDCITVLRDDNIQVGEGGNLVFSPLKNDSLCPKAFTVNLQALSNNGITASPTATLGTFNFHSDYGKLGSQTFRYTVQYTGGESQTALINVSVLPDTACASRLKANPDTNASTRQIVSVLIPFVRLRENDIICNNDDVLNENVQINTINNMGTVTRLVDGFLFTPRTGTAGQKATIPYTLVSKRNSRVSSTSYVRITITP